MIFLFQFLPLLLPLNQTFTCHKGSVPISINDTRRILDVKIEKREHPSTSKEMRLSPIQHIKNLTKFSGCRGNQESRISKYITYGEVG